MGNETKGMLFGFLGVVVFGLTLPATTFAVNYLPPIFLGLSRASLASLVALVVLFVTKSQFPTRKQLLQLLIVGAGVAVCFPVFSAWGMLYLPASHGAVILALLPITTVLFSCLIYKEKPSFGFWLCAIFGSSIVMFYTVLKGFGRPQFGDLILLLANCGAALGYAIGGKLSQQLGGWRVICWALVVISPFNFVFTFLNFPETISNIPLIGWSSFLYLALMSQLFGFFLWYKGLALGGVSRVSQVQLLQPFITILAASFLLLESIDLKTILAATLVIFSVALSKKMPIFTR